MGTCRATWTASLILERLVLAMWSMLLGNPQAGPSSRTRASDRSFGCGVQYHRTGVRRPHGITKSKQGKKLQSEHAPSSGPKEHSHTNGCPPPRARSTPERRADVCRESAVAPHLVARLQVVAPVPLEEEAVVPADIGQVVRQGVHPHRAAEVCAARVCRCVHVGVAYCLAVE